MRVEVFDDERMQLGEGPHWSSALNALCWVDILANKVVVRSDLFRYEFTEFALPSSVISSSSSTLNVVDAFGVWELNLSNSQKKLISSIPQGNSENRSNEAQRDANGNIWIGRMNRNDSIRSGELICMAQTGETSVAIEDMGIPNTLVWDLVRERMYFADSSEGIIYVAPLENGFPNFLKKSNFSKFEDELGTPDGSAIKANGNILNARWGAGCVLEIDPDGSVVDTISIPTINVTSCALNHDESILYVTTASVGLNPSDDSAGCTFAVEF
jgi:sugar lactone lactonase YvrE